METNIKTRKERIQNEAIRYLSQGYDDNERQLMLSGERKPHPVHEAPIVQAFIAGVQSMEQEIVERDRIIGHLTSIVKGNGSDVEEENIVLRSKLACLWVNADDRLPDKLKLPDGTVLSCSVDVLANVLSDGTNYLKIVRYDYKRNQWYFFDDRDEYTPLAELWCDEEDEARVTSWMLIPKA